MKAFSRTLKIVGVIIVAILIATGGGLLWLRGQFDEEASRHLDSLSADLGVRSILFVGAHPDDEQLVTGLLIDADRNGVVTYMLTGTRGEKGHQYPRVARDGDLGVVRTAEALQNSYALGVEEHDVLDYPDGGLAQTPFLELVAVVHARLTRWKPELVTTFWPESGFSRHADHMTMGKAALAAAEQLRANPVEGYAGPGFAAFLLAPTRAMRLLGGERGRWVADHQPTADITINGEGWAKLRGWTIHRSQRYYVQADYGLPDWFVHRIWNTEHYHISKLDSTSR